MKSIDQRIKEELEREGAALDSQFATDSIPAMVMQAFEGATRGWMWVVSIFTTLFGVATIWLIIEFVSANDLESKVTWGVWLVLSTIVMLAFEMWAWMQVNRVSINREIKALELRQKHSATRDEIERLSLAIQALGTKVERK